MNYTITMLLAMYSFLTCVGENFRELSDMSHVKFVIYYGALEIMSGSVLHDPGSCGTFGNLSVPNVSPYTVIHFAICHRT